ncbi:hypothetical protein RCCGEPOP_33438 [Rhizobium sp. Pop5]|nr:hypothetical protein RCCGEPOP_33438 [Rhizobium sp. Pop5]
MSAKPMPKPGGTVEKVNVACEKSYDLHGRPVKERVGKITSPAAISLTTNITRSFFCAAVAKEMPAKTRGLVLVTQELHGRRRRTFDRNPRGRQVLQLGDPCLVLRRARTTAFVRGREPSIMALGSSPREKAPSGACAAAIIAMGTTLRTDACPRHLKGSTSVANDTLGRGLPRSSCI